MPTGSISLTPFTHGLEGPANASVRGQKDSPKVGKFTHPSAAPTAAVAKPDYPVWDLVNTTPLLTDKSLDESKKKWDSDDKSGLRVLKKPVVNVEYYRDVRPRCLRLRSFSQRRASAAT